MSFGARGNSNGVHLRFLEFSAFYHTPGAFRYLGIFFADCILLQLNQGMKYEGYYEITDVGNKKKKQQKVQHSQQSGAVDISVGSCQRSRGI